MINTKNPQRLRSSLQYIITTARQTNYKYVVHPNMKYFSRKLNHMIYFHIACGKPAPTLLMKHDYIGTSSLCTFSRRFVSFLKRYFLYLCIVFGFCILYKTRCELLKEGSFASYILCGFAVVASSCDVIHIFGTPLRAYKKRCAEDKTFSNKIAIFFRLLAFSAL